MVDFLWNHDGERWAIIENKSGNLECVPEKSLELIKEQTIYYTLNDYKNGK